MIASWQRTDESTVAIRSMFRQILLRRPELAPPKKKAGPRMAHKEPVAQPTRPLAGPQAFAGNIGTISRR